MDRIYKQFGQGYGAEPATMIARIDGDVVFNGKVPTLNEPVPIISDSGVELFDWTEDALFGGNLQFEVEVTSGTVILTSTFAQVSPIAQPTLYSTIFHEIHDDVIYLDPYLNPSINGIAQPGQQYDPSLTGQYHYTIPSGSVFSAILRVNNFGPMYLEVVDPDLIYTVGVHQKVMPVIPHNVVDPITYSIDPPLPDGLLLGSGMVITGTPTVAANKKDYVLTVSDSDNQSQSATVSIEVLPA